MKCVVPECPNETTRRTPDDWCEHHWNMWSAWPQDKEELDWMNIKNPFYRTFDKFRGDNKMNEDSCSQCGKLTEEGKRRWKQNLKQKYPKVDFSKPLSKLIEDIRMQIVKSRSELQEISFHYEGWGERLKDVEGLLTCGLVALHHTKTEMQQVEKERKEKGLSGIY